MRSFGILLAVLALIAFVTVMNSFYTVRQDQQALVLQFGRPVAVKNVAGTDEAGLYFKLPLMQTVVLLDKKNIGYNLRDLDVLASDQRRLEVDAFVRWRISDPINFYQRLRTEGIAGERIDSFTESALRGALGQVPVPEIVSGQRAELMQRIRDEVNVNMEPFGVDIIDVRIRQADLPQSIAVGVYDRMKSAREQEAARIRAEGEEQARLIRARANREAQVLEAQARQQAETIQGDGDAQRNEIYAEAYGGDGSTSDGQRRQEFFRFYRSLLACEESIKDGTQVILSPDDLNVCDVFQEQARLASR